MLTRSIYLVALICALAWTPNVRASDAARDSIESRPLGAAAPAAATGDKPAEKEGEGLFGGSFFRTAGSLAAVLALVFVAAVVAKKVSKGRGLAGAIGAGGRAPCGVLEVLGRYPVARGTTLVLLKCDRRVLLVCQTAGKGLTGGATMTTLTEFQDAEDVASILLKTRDDEGDTLAKKFQAMLGSQSADVEPARSAASVEVPTQPLAPARTTRQVRAVASSKAQVAIKPASNGTNALRRRLETMRDESAVRPASRGLSSRGLVA